MCFLLFSFLYLFPGSLHAQVKKGAVSQLRQLCGNLKALDGGIGLTPHFGFNGFQEESLESLIPYPA